MSLRLVPALVLVIGAVLPMSAVDIDVRLSLGSAAMVDEIDVDGQGTSSLVDETSGAGSLTGHVFFGDGLIGFMVGGGFRAAVHAGDQEAGGTLFGGQAADLTYTGKAVLLEAGVTINPLPLWRIELRPQIALGRGEVEIDVVGNNVKGEAGDYTVYGGMIGNYLQIGWFEIGVDLGYESFTGESEIPGSNTESKGEGFVAQLGLGLIF